ncbi:ABC transporter permease [Vibrio sp. MACH09]|uniref:ABC transporter permease n=1 Tax=Vibrio sp. MACH09 TaxID=3025122 RepID=UPI00278DB33F|nr:ABC transporter permease [Vibrio sp. MACH09]GLO62449.1 ABC transporter permease [Vibrio sp. MACH09]
MKNKVKIIATPVLILIYWQLVSSSGLVSSYLLPPPYMVATAAQNMLENGVLINHILTSLERVFQGFLISCFLAFNVALLTHWSSTLEHLVSAPLALLRMIPPLAMTPLLILWLGIGNATQLSIIVLASVFPIYLNIRDGLQRVRPEYRELASSLGLSPLRFFTFIMIPSAVPSIVTGVRLGFGYSWRALIGAELIAASAGLGFLIIDSQEMMRTDDVMVGILTIGLIGWLLDTLFYRVVCGRITHRFPEVAK